MNKLYARLLLANKFAYVHYIISTLFIVFQGHPMLCFRAASPLEPSHSSWKVLTSNRPHWQNRLLLATGVWTAQRTCFLPSLFLFHPVSWRAFLPSVDAYPSPRAPSPGDRCKILESSICSCFLFCYFMDQNLAYVKSS